MDIAPNQGVFELSQFNSVWCH